MKRISQREARQLRKRVAELERRQFLNNRLWSAEYPGGVHIATEQFNAENYARIETALRLGRAVVAKPTGKDRYVYLYGVTP